MRSPPPRITNTDDHKRSLAQPLVLLAHEGVDVIFYDQGGCGESSFQADPASTHPHLLKIPYYVEEL